jgi:hypothetical protein
VAWADVVEAGLYQEELMPHTNLFQPQQMWWEEPYDGLNAGLKFARAMVLKWEEHRGLRVNWHHDKFPFVDGPRGIGWTSTYIMGQVDRRKLLLRRNRRPTKVHGPNRHHRDQGGMARHAWEDPVGAQDVAQQVRHNETFEGRS